MPISHFINNEGDPLFKTIDDHDTINAGVEHVAPSMPHDACLFAPFIVSVAENLSLA